MNVGITVTINTAKLKGIQRTLGAMNTVPPPAPVAAMFNQWASVYSVFTIRRYNRNARGGGDWAPLALSTINARRDAAPSAVAGIRKREKQIRSGRGGSLGPQFLARDTKRGSLNLVRVARKASILIDTGILRNAVQAGAAGNKITNIPGGIRYGFSAMGHAGKGKGRPMTVGRLATIHHFGSRRIPARPILVRPDAATLRRFEAAARTMISRLTASGGAA
jgi:hypothetical protein